MYAGSFFPGSSIGAFGAGGAGGVLSVGGWSLFCSEGGCCVLVAYDALKDLVVDIRKMARCALYEC